ncbi:7-cyano-7-deazaguanine synthase [Methanobacterium spitsbergense]|uniref:7-cyano-7-deazaguanine synthase n=1 Tax=Methanobacterium spitsbergense TaxID=2874285 RepID=A0A8T5V2Y7_9EURY|nr:7-cyano-7-deazaguanine synthase [Methanobacterium spitsbergense]MBZ2166035.1 7-cyano-7-deazaguanine synthase [Methanobacterium spitsbergense]
MKLEVEYMVETLSSVLKPLIANGSFELSDIDFTENLGFFIEKITYDDISRNLIITAPDRPEKSSIIGKGGWVVGKLREELGVNNIHVDAYSDMIIRVYRMELAMKKLEKIVTSIENQNSQPLKNLQDMIMLRMNNLDSFDFLKEFDMELSNFKSEEANNIPVNEKHKAVVALSGGVDSSFSLIIAKLMGFNPLAVTVNPGNIILPSYFRNNVESLCNSLNVPHEYIDVKMESVVDQALKGKLHPCGRCSKIIETALLEYSKKIEIPFLIFGDFLATGSQSIVSVDGLWRINLPAMLSATKGETKSLSTYFNIKSRGGYGCPLINEVHKAHPHMRRFSIQRILRETRAGVLEPGQALDLIIKTL